MLTKMVPVYWGVAFVNPGKENGNKTALSLSGERSEELDQGKRCMC